MSEVLKRRIVVGMLAALAAWPLIQLALTSATGNDPAHTVGWTSFSRAWFPPRVLLWKKVGGAWRPLDGNELSVEAKIGMANTIWRMATRPSGARPDAVGELLRAQTVGASAVRVEVREIEIDPDSARVVIETELFDYE